MGNIQKESSHILKGGRKLGVRGRIKISKHTGKEGQEGGVQHGD